MSTFSVHAVTLHVVKAPNGMTVGRFADGESAAKVVAYLQTLDLTRPEYRFLALPVRGQMYNELTRQQRVRRELVAAALNS